MTDPFRSLEADASLPPGRLIRPALDGPATRSGDRAVLWISEEEAYEGAFDLASDHPGLIPVVLFSDRNSPERPWLDGELATDVPHPPDHLDAEALFAEWSEDWPGLAAPGTPGEDPEEFAEQFADVILDMPGSFGIDGDVRLGLVPAARRADVPAAVGWLGATNHMHVGKVSAVLRSWEDRFGARLVAVGFDELFVSVAAPPTTTEHARRVAAEHYAFCPDIIDQGGVDLEGYAEALAGAPKWYFWFD